MEANTIYVRARVLFKYIFLNFKKFLDQNKSLNIFEELLILNTFTYLLFLYTLVQILAK
jgi:hypothetical protein